MKQETKAKQPKKPNIILRLLAVLLTGALILGAAALIVYRDELNLNALKRWLTYRDLETSETGQAEPFTHAGGDRLSLAYLENGILTASAAGAHYYSFSGDLFAEEVVAMDNPILSASDKAGVVYDAGGQSLFLFRGTEETFDLTLEGSGDLLSARVNDSGWLAVTAQQSGYKGAVTVYDQEGEKVIQISLSSTFVMDAAISPDCKTVAVVTMDQEGGRFSSQVLFYPVNQKEPSAQTDLDGITVLDLDYESGALWVLGEDRILTVDPSSGSVQGSYSFSRSYLKGCSFGPEGYALLLTGRYQAGEANEAITVASDGTPLACMELNTPVLDCSGAGDYFALLTGSQLQIFDRQAQSYASLDTTQGARYAALSPDGSALLANAQQAWLYIPN